MKNSSKAALILSCLFLTCPSVLAGGIEMPPPVLWDFYIGGSAVGYGYSYHLNSTTVINPPTFAGSLPLRPFVLPVPVNYPLYRDIKVLGGFDIGAGVWGDRGYFGIEGRYDIGRLGAENSANFFFPVILSGNPLSVIYQATFSNNAFILAKIGYQLLPRIMPYIVFGWARATYQLSGQIFGRNSTIAGSPTNVVEQFASNNYRKSLNGGMVGIGTSYLLVDGLSAFVELSGTAYRIPKEIREGVQFTTDTSTAVLIPQTNVLNFNYCAYNLRMGLNWSFASLI